MTTSSLPVLREIGEPSQFGRGPWLVRVRDAGGRVRSVHHCWWPGTAVAYARELKTAYPDFKVSVRRPGRRREVAA